MGFADYDVMGFVGVADLSQAKIFYGGTLGLTLRDESPFALVADFHGTMLRITAVGEPVTARYTVLGWRVPGIEAAVDDLVARGVTFQRYGLPDQDERGIWTAPDGTRVAWFTDPDNNILSLTEFAE